MKYTLINEYMSPNLSPLEQILVNRGLKMNDLENYINADDSCINPPESLGEENLKAGLTAVLQTVNKNGTVLVVVDCDCDGYTSGALIVNYLYDIFPSWVSNNLSVYLHDGKQHGLNDCIDYIKQNRFDLVICPDSSSNDFKEHQIIKEYGGQVLILDHHLADKISTDAIIINNQLSNYPNKELSGVGVTWQFCRYFDKMIHQHYADNYIDLVALGNDADMMSLLSIETKYLINKGFRKENIKNPFIEYMLDKNSFPLSKTDYVPYEKELACTSYGAAFFIVPFVNAMTRSGAPEDKQLLFNSMLNFKAFNKVPSNKRGAKGQEDLLVLNAMRVVNNTKNHQDRAVEAGMEYLKKKIEEEDMLNKHNFLLFLLEDANELPSEIRGLIANKFINIYQRPCCILTKNTYTAEDGKKIPSYEGSMRGYTKFGLMNFKEVLDQCAGTLYCQGHENAAGLGIRADSVDEFMATIDAIIDEYPHEPMYQVDYLFDEKTVENNVIFDIAEMNSYWGQDVERPYVVMKFKVTNSNFAVMAKQTLKITLNNGLSLIKFAGTEEDIETFTTTGWKEIEAVCKCCENNWNGRKYPQLIISDYQVVDSSKYFF